MNVSEAFIRRPIGTSLLMAGILVFGIVSYELLPVAALPTVDFPTISVTAKLPGASPDDMAASVATPLEQQFAAIPGLAQMTSTSGLGNTTITLQFDLDRNIDGAAGDVQTAINAASGLLPKDMPSPPTYKKTNPANYAILIYAVWSDALPIYRVDDYAFTDLAQKMSSIPGVAEVDIAGQQQYAVHVQVNPLELAARNLGLEDVRNALVAATLDEPKGNLEGKNQVYSLDTNDQMFDAAAFAKTIIAYRNGAPVRIEDIGRTVNSSQSPRTASWFGDKRIELLLVRRATGANTLAVVDAIKAEMPSLLVSIPKTVHVKLVADRSLNIRNSVYDVQLTLLLTIALVVGVIFLFLHNIWATIIPSVVVPLSLVATFGVMYVLGYSLDNLSLMALTISVGFVVDDAIVMIENIVRYIEMGLSPLEAALKGSGQIGFTIISITFSLVSVFIPLLFMAGIVGRLFREFAMTVTTAVLVSAFVSLTLTPVMCARFLTREGTHGTNFISRWSEYLFNRLIGGYDRGLKWVFRHQPLMLALTLTLIVVTGFLYVYIPKGFFPEQDTGFIFGQAVAREDASFASIAKIENQFAKIIGADPAVSGVVGFAGATGGNASESTARMFIQLKPISERGASAQQVIQRLRPKVAAVEGAKFYMQAGQDIHIGGRLTKTEYQYTLTDTDSNELNHWAPILEQAMRKAPQLQDVASDQEIASPHIAISINRNEAYKLGLSLSTIDQTLYDAFGERQIATIYTSSQQNKVILEVEPQFQNDPAALSRIYLTTTAGNRIPLSTIATFTRKVEPLTVNHQGQFPAVTLSFNVAPGYSLGQAVSRIDAIQESLRTPATLTGTFQGTAEEFQKSLVTMPLLILAAIVVVYIVLGFLYESYIHPITILSALPSAGVGALIMLRLFGYDLTVIAIIGIVLLIGIVKKNAIMMVDFALSAERNEGKSPLEAIHEACLLRFRPIMMTTMSALLAGLPLAFGSGAGSELRRPLGIAIVGGLLVSQALTLFTTPVIYLYLDRFSHWLRGRRVPNRSATPIHPSAVR
jgi:hydrophobe/amphiphile efflux-1 (HAE1) family protein